MEVYFKDLISEDGSLEKLVDDLEDVVQGAHHFAATVAPSLPEPSQAELNSHLARLKENYQRFKQHASDSVKATDHAVRKNPYWTIGAALLVGLAIGAKLRGRR
jgi:ElaB/YqjD/DUF883 family membrane-anchored ribosome-binding protein